MKTSYWAAVAFVAAMGLGAQAKANVVEFFVGGAGYSAKGYVTIAPDVSPADPNPACGTSGNPPCRSDPASAWKITGVSGTFSSAADGISNAAITSLIPISPAVPHDLSDPLVPTSISFFNYTGGQFSYDNLFFPNGSVQDCLTFPFVGTLFDDYGTGFTVAGGYTVNLWGDGDLHGPGSLIYGVTVLRDGALLSTSFDGLTAVPEPSTWMLMLTAFAGLGLRLRQRRSQRLAVAA